MLGEHIYEAINEEGIPNYNESVYLKVVGNNGKQEDMPTTTPASGPNNNITKTSHCEEEESSLCNNGEEPNFELMNSQEDNLIEAEGKIDDENLEGTKHYKLKEEESLSDEDQSKKTNYELADTNGRNNLNVVQPKASEDESKEKPTDDSSKSPYELEDKYSHPINEQTKPGNEGADNNLNEVQPKAFEDESEEKLTDDSSNSPYELEDKYGNPINEQTKPGHEIEDKYNYGKQKGKKSNSSDDTKKIDHYAYGKISLNLTFQVKGIFPS